MNARLIEPYTTEEVKRALFQMHPDKAPGVDGFSPRFYQKFWEKIKVDVSEEVLNFLNNGVLDTTLNVTQIVLLPKKEVSSKVEDYRPISLCNVSMKLITKVLANRLCDFLPMVISPNQSAFLKGRLITDNILTSQEVCHYVMTRKRGSEGVLSIKMDMSKVYDRVEWNFLKHVLRRIGFHPTWISRVMLCVQSVSYNLKINDHQSEVVMPTRGLRQGDPLSPFLFLICQEWFSTKLNKSQDLGLVEGISLALGMARMIYFYKSRTATVKEVNATAKFL